MARASTPTLLSLDRWAKILGINPVHFNGAVGSAIWPANGACQDIWPQYSWQTSEELIGREDVAMTIATVEEDIANAIGCHVAPVWEVDEAHSWQSHHKVGRATPMQTGRGMVIAPGVRAVAAVQEDAAVVRSDPDGDGWSERATITVATSLTDKREIKVYYAGHDGDPEWEIRPLRSVTLSGGNAVIVLDAWLLIDPDLWEAYPTDEAFQGIDVTDANNFVTTVDVYREYNDTTAAGVTFYTGGNGYNCCGGVGCDVCSGDTFNGCFSVRDSRLGLVFAFPAAYGENGWYYSYPTYCQPVRRASLSYYAGLRDKRYLSGSTLDPLSDYLAEAITWMAAARLPESICNCDNIRDRVENLQKDASRMREGGQTSPLYARFERMDIFGCPFGTRVGEVAAWQRVVRLQGEIGGAVLI